MARGSWGAVLGVLATLLAASPPAGAATIEVVGPQQTVYDYNTMRCASGDSADGTPRAFRDASNRVQVVVPGPNRRMIGPSLDSLTHDCVQVLQAHQNEDPALFDDLDWLAGTYTEDGQTIHALVHAEYHGFRHPGWCPGEPLIKCRYNAVTYAVSTDAGESFVHPPGPQNLVAAIPHRYVPGDGRYGYFSPSNIVKRGNYYYALIIASAFYGYQRPGTCVMRTLDLSQPRSWRAWDGDGYNVRFVDPYRESPEPMDRHVCQPVSHDQIRDMDRSLTYNSILDKYVVTGTSNIYDAAQGRQVFGAYFSTSDDLIHWTDRQLIMETETLGTHLCGDPPVLVYPAILDSDSSDQQNFTETDGSAYLYFSELPYNSSCQIGQVRNLVRFPIQISP
jgi:hypothetical protein